MKIGSVKKAKTNKNTVKVEPPKPPRGFISKIIKKPKFGGHL